MPPGRFAPVRVRVELRTCSVVLNRACADIKHNQGENDQSAVASARRLILGADLRTNQSKEFRQ